MSDDSSSYNLSFLSPSTFDSGPAGKGGINLISTPINSKQDAEELSPVDLDEITRASNPRTPTSRSDLQQEKLHSILKSSRNKSTPRTQFQDEPITESVLRRYPELRLAAKDGNINPVKGARVIFSPTKEVLSYRSEYFDDYSEQESANNLRKLRRNKAKRESYDHDDDCTVDLIADNINKPSSRKEIEKDKTSIITNLITNPKIPYVLSLYLQLFVNLLLIGWVVYFGFMFIWTIKSDIVNKLQAYTSDAMQQISLCSREYYRNKCSIEDGQKRVPALEKACTAWSKCMNRDPQLIGRLKITAEVFADVVNGFVKSISWKSLFFMYLLVTGTLFIINIAFMSYRNYSGLDIKKDVEETIKSYEKKIEEQNKLIEEYKSRLQERSNTSMNTNNSYVTTYAGSTPRVGRIQAPNTYNQILLHDQNANGSPLLNRKKPYI